MDSETERLRNELRMAQTRLALVEKQLSGILESPAWRLIDRWRGWVARNRRSVVGRLADRLGRSAISASGADAVPSEPSNNLLPAQLPGRLIVCPDPPYNGKVFYAINGRRHWALTVEHLACYGLRLEDAVGVSGDVIAGYANAGQLPRVWPPEAWTNPARTSPVELREIAASRLRGKGVEFGAGTYPVAIPLECDVRFADYLSETQLKKAAYEAQGDDFVRLDYVTSLEDMNGIEDGSLDFIIACHVIEHVPNPLKAIHCAYRKLRAGGQFLLVVPDKTRTFDRPRGVTPLAHLIEDYERPSRERDAEDYRDFFTTVYTYTPEQVKEAIEAKRDLHYHTWTFESFGETIDYARRIIAPWSDVWSQPAIEGNTDSIEFYFVLVK